MEDEQAAADAPIEPVEQALEAWCNGIGDAQFGIVRVTFTRAIETAFKAGYYAGSLAQIDKNYADVMGTLDRLLPAMSKDKAQ